MALALDLAAALDPVVFAERAGLEPDGWQQRVIRSGARRILLNCSRQSGKSTMAALTAVHTSVYEPGSLSLLLSPTQRQSSELFKKCLALYRGAGRPIPSEAESALFLGLENGSRIVCLPGKEGTVRGYSGVALLVIDEAAWVPSELYASVRPMLAVSGGRLMVLSTPHGNRGWFFEAWRSDEPWDRYEVPASQCPRINPSWLEEERQTMGDWWFEQEYNCKFLDAESQAFSSAAIDRAFQEEVEVWQL